MTRIRQTSQRFRIYRNDRPTQVVIGARNENDAILGALMMWGQRNIGPRHELTAKPVPEPDEAREREAEESSTAITEEPTKDHSEDLPLICQYTHQFCQRKERRCPHQKEIRKAKNGHEMIELASECPARGESMSKDEYNDQSRERVREAVRKWDYKLWWRA